MLTFICFTCPCSVYSIESLINSTNPFIDGFFTEINNLCGPSSYRYIAYCHFIRIYVDMNTALVAPIHQVWNKFET